jgi:hypothetical protein
VEQSKGYINTHLLQGVGNARMEGHDVGTTTTINAFNNTKFTRRVFETEFGWTDIDEAKKPNWDLEAKLYSPSVSAQNDLSYVLLTDDVWSNDCIPNLDYRKYCGGFCGHKTYYGQSVVFFLQVISRRHTTIASHALLEHWVCCNNSR